MILISGSKENVQVEAKLGGSSLNMIPLLDSLMETTLKILSEVPKEHMGEAFNENKLLLLKLLVLNGSIFKKLSEFAKIDDEE